MSDIIRVIDFETCGFPDEGNGQICEVATLDLVHDHGAVWRRGRAWQSLINPGRPIPPEASAVHHITDQDVACAPAFGDDIVQHGLTGGCDNEERLIFAAHNAVFEQAVWPNPHTWICSYKVAVGLWPDSPSHSNQCLRYYLKLKLADPALAVPHRAACDVYVTAAILRRAFMEFFVTADEMIAVSARPAVLPRMTFGEHVRKPFAEVPTDYLQWMLGKPDLVKQRPNEAHTARLHLDARRNPAPKAESPPCGGTGGSGIGTRSEPKEA